jgi:uncharacterized protein YbbC (DUF1343 family)/CubicO group peptidase (beta-lactamase class C family)
MRYPLIFFLLLMVIRAAEPGGGFRSDRLEAMDAAVKRNISEGKIPGGVLWVETKDGQYSKAYGQRAIVPAREVMTVDTVFDAASLTKVVATTTAVMKLHESGKIDLEQKLAHYLPEMADGGKEAITVRQLLTHTSGLRSGISSKGEWSGLVGAMEEIRKEAPTDAPGSSYRYSDINYILLGAIVEKVSGEHLDAYCAREIFTPLGMTRTGYLPKNPAETAPTEKLADGEVLRGTVHDPTARKMGGVAGHAGLFTTAEDLAKFARMMLSGGGDVLKPETIKLMTSVQTPDWLPRRGLGWDIDSPYAGLRGNLLPIGGYGHTGWTGTSLWIDPFSRTFIIFLSNRNHPSGGNSLVLQRELGTLTAQAVANYNFLYVPGALPVDPKKVLPATPAAESVLNGVDVLKREGFARLRGMKIGLVTNHTGQDRTRSSTIDLLHKADGVELKVLFSPEHGIRGEEDHEKITDTKDEGTGLPVKSLYGKTRSPMPSDLEGLDALVFDIQDIGCRFYTYISTMSNCIEQAGKSKVKFIILDRVNPIGPVVEGPVLTEERSFIATHEIPVRHGMTVGELGLLINGERKFGAMVEVVKCEGSGLKWYDRCGLPWKNPSPNMRSLDAATLYPGVGLLEFCDISVGRGTDAPFSLVGAPYVDELRFAEELTRAGLPGVGFVPVRFTPVASVFKGKDCGGVRILVTNRDAFRPVDLGVVMASVFHRLYGKQAGISKMLKLTGDRPTVDAILGGKSLDEIRVAWEPGLRTFSSVRTPYLLYPR